jgi:hypothetical protein
MDLYRQKESIEGRSLELREEGSCSTWLFQLGGSRYAGAGGNTMEAS